MRRRLARRPMLSAVVLSVIATAIGVYIALAIDWFPTPASSAAGEIDTLYDVLLIASVPIFVLVMAVVIYCVLMFRAKPGDLSDGPPIHGNTRLEVVWVTIPFLLVTGLAIYGWQVLNDIEAKASDRLTVNVKGQQFAWNYTYADSKVKTAGELVLPIDRQVEFKVRTDDVLHDFWVPAFRLKTDAVPGLTTNIRTTPKRLGTYDVVCAELCGLGHATMRSRVRVVPKAEYAAWIAKKQGGKKQ